MANQNCGSALGNFKSPTPRVNHLLNCDEDAGSSPYIVGVKYEDAGSSPYIVSVKLIKLITFSLLGTGVGVLA